MLNALENHYDETREIPEQLLRNILILEKTPYAQYNANALLSYSFHHTNQQANAYKQQKPENQEAVKQLHEKHNELVDTVENIYLQNFGGWLSDNDIKNLSPERFKFTVPFRPHIIR